MLKYTLRFLILVCLIFSSVASFARGLHDVIELIQTETNDGVVLQGLRYANPGRPRYLLIHGFSENTYALKEHAKELYEQGNDVYMFNFRGHGNGTHESRHPTIPVNELPEGFMSFDRIIGMDIPAMIEYVHDGEPIMIVGHSLGGVSARLFLSGVRMRLDGEIYLTKNKDKIEKYLNMVKVLIANASPTTFDIDYLHYNAWTKLGETLGPKLTAFLTNLGIGVAIKEQNPIQPPRGPIVTAVRNVNNRIHTALHTFLLSAIYTGLINVDNFSFQNDEAGRIFLQGFTKVQRHLIEDAIRWRKESRFKNGFRSRNGKVIYESLPIPEGLNFYMVGGSLDKLAPVSKMLVELAKIGRSGNVTLIELKDFAHVDIAAGTKSAKILTKIYSILQNNPSGEEFLKAYGELREILVYKSRPILRSCVGLFRAG